VVELKQERADLMEKRKGTDLLSGGDPLLKGPDVLVRGRRQEKFLGALCFVLEG
jgi:hypothetical protein